VSAHQITDKNPKFFYDTKGFPFLNILSKNFDVIKSELLSLIEKDKENLWLETFPDYVSSENKKAWKVFSFIFFSMKFPDNAAICPKTAKLIYSIPEIISCDYSFLKPNSHIRPHKGYTRMVLRCHLPLIVPPRNKCSIRVGDEIKDWEEGKLIIFDDSFEHEAWNRSDQNRAVLMFDIPNPLWGYSAYEISKYKIENIDDPFLLSMVTKEKWQEAFKKGEFPLNSFNS
jgi:aspartyl/asparaginyl beta-hydroxylase (cupin superfamily)